MRFTDTGCGIGEERLDLVFEPFYSTKPIPRGQEERAPGFGLAVVHAIIQELEGRVSVTSEVGKSTTFEVWLPSGMAAIERQQPDESA